MQAPGTEGLRRLAQEFGPTIVTADGELDRARLADIAFNDPDARRRLNAIVHPLVREWMARRQQEAAERGDQVVVLDIPLLFESRGAGMFEDVLLIYAPEELQIRRLVELRGMTTEQARARVAAQMPIEEKRKLATHVVENTGTMTQLQAQVDRVWAGIAGPRPHPPPDAQNGT